MKKLAPPVLLILLVLLVACGEESAPSAGSEEPEARPSRRAPGVSAGPEQGGELDGLTLTLELSETTLAPGEETDSQIVIENETSSAITDPACLLGSPSYGIVPVDQPNAELEHVSIVDCGGPYDYPPGVREQYPSHRFRAATIRGKQLPPGEYVAVMEFNGVSERLTVPVTIEED